MRPREFLDNSIHFLSESIGIDAELLTSVLKSPILYTRFQIPKKRGGYRSILKPSSSLSYIQRKLYQYLGGFYAPHLSTHGFVLQRSIVSNAREHIGCHVLLNIDLEDYFGSIGSDRLYECLQYAPYSFAPDIAQLIVQLTTYQGALPQGAPTSPLLANSVSTGLDNDLALYAAGFDLVYTRYADDISFSTDADILPRDVAVRRGRKIDLGKRLIELIEAHQFKINNAKVRIQGKGQRKVVTGIIVSERLNVSRKYVNQVRSMLHSLKRDGADAALTKHLRFRILSRPSVVDFRQIVRGKIEYIGMVRGRDDALYLSLCAQLREALR